MVSLPSLSWPGAFAPMAGAGRHYRVSWRQCRYPAGLSVAERQAFVNLHVSEFALTEGIRYVYSAPTLLWHGETQDCFPSAPFLQQVQELTAKL